MTFQQPVSLHRTDIEVVNSRFICTINKVTSLAEAKAFLAEIRLEMPDASHHVYAFRVGHGNSIVEGMSDDGEPSGTAGPPVMAVLRGSGLGNIAIVVTRYFGGTKLGTGGLVRAYGDAAKAGLSTLRTEYNIPKRLIGIETPYPLYELVKRLLHQHECVIEDESFAGDVTLMVVIPLQNLDQLRHDLSELSNGQIEPLIFD